MQRSEDSNGYGKSIARLSNMLVGGVIVQRFGDLIRGRRSTQSRIDESFITPTLNAALGDLSLVLPKRILAGYDYQSVKESCMILLSLSNRSPCRKNVVSKCKKSLVFLSHIICSLGGNSSSPSQNCNSIGKKVVTGMRQVTSALARRFSMTPPSFRQAVFRASRFWSNSAAYFLVNVPVSYIPVMTKLPTAHH